MTVRELISLNQMIIDVQITVRIDGTKLLDQLNIGPYQGQKPPYPLKVPKRPEWAGTFNEHMRKEATYNTKSINSWDDGKDYWNVKPERLPKAWLDLEVYSWDCKDAGIHGVNRRTAGVGRNVNFYGKCIDITALPSGQTLEVPTPKKDKGDDLEGQISISEWLRGRVNDRF